MPRKSQREVTTPKANSSKRPLTFKRYTSPYAVWMMQRPLDAYHALEPADRQRVDKALRGTGCEALFERPPRHRLGKLGIDLAFS